MSPVERAHIVKTLGYELGFDRVGITSTDPVAEADYYRNWLALGYAGTMTYLHQRTELRTDPSTLIPGARSIICVALSYHREDPLPAPNQLRGRVARYARGKNYHVVLVNKLREFIENLRERLPETFDARAFVDTGPLLERQLAARAGIGWVGKNTLVMHEKLGSYLFLGEVVTTLELAADPPATDHCGSCTRCIDACPTRAFPNPYQMDASRCISYLTIEHRGEIPAELKSAVGGWVYGCDICQEVCPHNRKAPLSTTPEFLETTTPPYPDLLELLEIKAGAYRRLVRDSAAERAGQQMWRRNAKVAYENELRRQSELAPRPGVDGGAASR